MPLGRDATRSMNSGKVVHVQSMPASIASAAISSARSRFRMTRCLSEAAQGASVNPQLPITTVVTPCQQEQVPSRSEEHTSELQSRLHLVCRLLLEKKKKQSTHYLLNQPTNAP